MTDRSPTSYARGFDAAAADFNRLGVHLWGPIGAALVAATRPVQGERVLDACCGTGASAIPAARAVGPAGVVDAVDVSEPMIDVVNAMSSLPQLRGHATDVLAWSDSDYDLVQAALGIFFFPDMTEGTDRLIGMASPGGRVGFTIWRHGAMEVAGEHLGRATAAIKGTEPPKRPRHLINEINNSAGYQAWLTERGLIDVQVIVDERSIPLIDELAWLIIIGSGYRAALMDLTPEAVADVREHYLQSLAADKITEIDATTLIGIGSVPG